MSKGASWGGSDILIRILLGASIGGFLGTSTWWEALGYTQNTLEGLYLIRPENALGSLRRSWTMFLWRKHLDIWLNLLPLRPGPWKPAENEGFRLGFMVHVRIRVWSGEGYTPLVLRHFLSLSCLIILEIISSELQFVLSLTEEEVKFLTALKHQTLNKVLLV